jgi:hypothetical protein
MCWDPTIRIFGLREVVSASAVLDAWAGDATPRRTPRARKRRNGRATWAVPDVRPVVEDGSAGDDPLLGGREAGMLICVLQRVTRASA